MKGSSFTHGTCDDRGRIRGCIKGLAGNYESALEDLDQALKLKPDDVLALVARGVFRFLSGDLVGALADLDQAIKHDPAQPADVLKLRDAIAKVSTDRSQFHVLVKSLNPHTADLKRGSYSEFVLRLDSG